MTDRDWREAAYLQKENWPDAIPWTGPKREYGPYPWGRPRHDELDPDVDEYPHSHPDAASIGHDYLGDVCPYCGVPVKWTEQVRLSDGHLGVFQEITELDEPEPGWHPECWKDRQAEIHGHENASLEVFRGP